MPESPEKPRYKHGLSFLATLAFVGGFFGARIFHLVFPATMVFFGPIHFHHFWYGLAMVIVSGWCGIVYNNERLERLYAVVFGLGAGFIGDEVGLLLTGTDYYSVLTFEFFVAAVAFVILVTLFLRHRTQIVEDVLRLRTPERMTHVGVFLVGFSALFFAFDMMFAAIPLAAVGCVLALWGFMRKVIQEVESSV